MLKSLYVVYSYVLLPQFQADLSLFKKKNHKLIPLCDIIE